MRGLHLNIQVHIVITCALCVLLLTKSWSYTCIFYTYENCVVL
jgi:hypothetical protein